MSLTVAITVGVAMGIVFGLALEKSRVFEPGIIVGQMQLSNFIMLKIFLTAVATGALVLALLNGLGYVKLQPKAALYTADIVGGLLLGAGITLAGAITYSYAQPTLSKTFLGQGGGKLIFTDLIGVPYWIGALALVAVIVVTLLALEAWRPWRDDLGDDVDGNLAPTQSTAPRTISAVPAE